MITSLHLHLILVHIPIVLYPVSAALLVTCYLKNNPSLRTAGSLLIIFATIAAISAYLTGEETEELAENIAGVLESAIEDHAEAALISLWLSCITATVAAAVIISHFWSKSRKPLLALLIVLSIISSLSFFWVGYQGGKIRHPEAYTSIDAGTQERVGDKD